MRKFRKPLAICAAAMVLVAWHMSQAMEDQSELAMTDASPVELSLAH